MKDLKGLHQMKAVGALMILLAILSIPLAITPEALAQVSGSDIERANSAIMNAGSRATKIRDIKRVPSVGVIRLDFNSIMSSSSDMPSPAQYRIMASRFAPGVAKLQQALRANPVTREVLESRGISPSQVAGVQISSNGSLRLYIFSR
jgi:hypothetical protein